MRVIQRFWFHLCISTVLAVYDKTFKIIYPPYTLDDESNFGYSVTYFNKQLFVSAPTVDKIGKIFSYNVIENSINEMEFEVERELPSKYTHGYWLGAYLTSGSKYVVACAPRSIYKYTEFVTNGVCYKFTSSDDITLLKEMEERHLLDGGASSFGWVIDINNETNIIAIGSPALDRSGVNIYENDKSSPRTKIESIRNFGYGIASGNFLSETEIINAISTTYGKLGKGQVFFCDKSLNSLELLDSGEVGSTYGAALCAARLGHTRNSLLVGAPTFASNGGYNTGAVYIYVPTEKAAVPSNALQNVRILKGSVDGGHYGASIISLGDMDGDGRDEVAIGAPYEGDGAVYIYSGFGLLNNKSWLQKIQPESFKSFGFSLAPIRDFDKPCTDIGVGAPLTNNAFILKCIQIVTVQLDAEISEIQKTVINGKACLNVLYPVNPRIIRSKIEVKVEMTHAAAKLEGTLDNNYMEPFIFDLEEQNSRICKDFNVELFDGNYEDLIVINFNAKINPYEESASSPPDMVLSERSVMSLQKSICAADCKSSCRCVPKLLPISPRTTLTNPYKLGLSQLERFSIFVENTGETAYDACVVISGLNAFVQSIPPSCSRYNSTRKFLCRPSLNILPEKIWQVGDIKIDTTSLTNKDENLSIHYDVYGHCEVETEKHSETINYKLIFDYTVIHISGASNPSKILNITDDDIGSVKKIQHIYTISNRGVIDFYDVLIFIMLPKTSYVKHHTPRLTLLRVNETLSRKCSSTVKAVHGVINIVCSIDLLKASDALLTVSIDVLPKNLDEMKNNVTVSEVHLMTSNQTFKERVETKLKIVSISIPKWVWIVAFLVALLILVIIMLILRRCGYFKRQHKKKLELHKRQSVVQFTNQNFPELDNEVNEKED